MRCTFFGHSNTQESIEKKLYEALVDLIENYNVKTFYVGNHGNFDLMARRCLIKLKEQYPHIDFTIVLAYLPNKKDDEETLIAYPTLYPDGLETTPPRFAIIKRNRWMIDNADYVVTYVTHPSTGAAQFKEIAEKKKKKMVNLI